MSVYDCIDERWRSVGRVVARSRDRRRSHLAGHVGNRGSRAIRRPKLRLRLSFLENFNCIQAMVKFNLNYY
jgi:hypothetical protein